MKMDALKTKNSQYEQQLRDLKDIKQSLSDQRSKEANSIDKNSYNKLKASMKKNADDPVVRFLLNSLTQICKGSEKMEYEAEDPMWSDFKSVQTELRQADPSKLDKSSIREMMK